MVRPMLVFPTHRFDFEDHEADIDRRVISGGTSVSGEEDLIATDGGGRVYCEFTEAYLDDPDIALEFRGLSTAGDGGATPMIVFFGDIRHQLVGDIFIPDDANDAEADYPATDPTNFVSADVALRATLLVLTLTHHASPIRKGQWLSIDHPVMRWRAYRIAEVVSQDGEDVTVRVRPPLREAVTANTPVEFANVRCVMRIDGEMRSPTSFGFAEGSVRFVEHFPGPEGYE